MTNFTQIPITYWTVGQYADNDYRWDAVGRGDDVITFYRNASVTLPCGFTVYQQMQMSCPVNNQYYSFGPVHVLQGIVGASTVESGKAGAVRSKSY
jgi:hypothetical protein